MLDPEQQILHSTPAQSGTEKNEGKSANHIQMALNENPFGPSPQVLEAIGNAAVKSNYYPDNLQLELREILAHKTGVRPEEVLITAGSAAFLEIAAHTLLFPGANAVTSARSYIMYRIVTEAAGANLIKAPIFQNTFDLDAIHTLLNPETRVVFIANPNNPTGTIIEPCALERFLDRLPEHVSVVIDEAYYDFADYFARVRGREYSRSLDYVRQGRNVLVLRSFSKVHSLAGLRIGYGIASDRMMRRFAQRRMRFSVSNVAAAAALAALADTEHVQKTLENNTTGAEWLKKEVEDSGVAATTTWGNFLYLETGDSADSLANRIEKYGIIVRPLTDWGAPTALRVTIGTPAQNEQFATALSKARKTHC